MGSSGKGVNEIFDLLESNKLGAVEEMKKVFHDHFLSSKYISSIYRHSRSMLTTNLYSILYL